jgi:hypothetical protein
MESSLEPKKWSTTNGRILALRGRTNLRESQFTEKQIAYALQGVELGTAVAEICRKLRVSEQTFYRLK